MLLPLPYFIFLEVYMARDFSKAFYNSKEWKKARASYIASKFGLCERCGRPNSKQVHHKIYLTPVNINDPDITLNFNNFELLCDLCHQNEHNEKYSATVNGLMFDENGDLVPVPEQEGSYGSNAK